MNRLQRGSRGSLPGCGAPGRLRPWAFAVGATLAPLLAISSAAWAALIPVRETGPSSNRVNAFFLGDGYTAADHAAGRYSQHVSSYVDYMFRNSINSDPFYRYRNFFNIYRVDVVSNQSGADRPQSGVVRDTALDATYRYDGVTDRLLYVNETKANAALNAAIAGTGKPVQMRFVTVNDTTYGGGGGRYAVYAGGNASAREVALHEMGHSFAGLADEYDYADGTRYAGGEPGEPNVTRSSTGAKWSRWIGYQDPTGGVVGAYEGARYNQYGIYRPTADSKMRSLNEPFNAVSRERLIMTIYNSVRPLDSYTPNTATLYDPAQLLVDRIDDDVIQTEWFLDGVMLAGLTGQSSLSLAGLSIPRGPHQIHVRAFDPTAFDPVNGWVRLRAPRMEQFVIWNVMITVPEPASLMLIACGVVVVVGKRVNQLSSCSTCGRRFHRR